MEYRIEEARRSRGWSQAELARRSGLTQQAIQRYESGEREPKVSAIVSMAAALGVTISYLLGLDRQSTDAADAFLDALDWVRADPRPDGMRTRAMGLATSADMDRKLTAELGCDMYAEPYDESRLAGRIELLTASYSPIGELVGLYGRYDGRLWSPCEWAHTPTIDATTDLR